MCEYVKSDGVFEATSEPAESVICRASMIGLYPVGTKGNATAFSPRQHVICGADFPRFHRAPFTYSFRVRLSRHHHRLPLPLPPLAYVDNANKLRELYGATLCADCLLCCVMKCETVTERWGIYCQSLRQQYLHYTRR